MRVIFLSDVPGSGLAGEVKEVKNGFARNFLIPKQLAVVATHDHLQRIETIRKTGDDRRIKEEQDLRALADHLSQISVTVAARVGPTGRLYGAVTSAHVAEELSRLTEREFDRRAIQLEKPIHEPGSYQAEVRLPQGIATSIDVTVLGEDAQGRIQTQQEAPKVPIDQEAPEAPMELEAPEAPLEQEVPEASMEQEAPEVPMEPEAPEESTEQEEPEEDERGGG